VNFLSVERIVIFVTVLKFGINLAIISLTEVICISCKSIIHCSKVTKCYSVHKLQMPLPGSCKSADALVVQQMWHLHRKTKSSCLRRRGRISKHINDFGTNTSWSWVLKGPKTRQLCCRGPAASYFSSQEIIFEMSVRN
jgi:hypothetical protein